MRPLLINLNAPTKTNNDLCQPFATQFIKALREIGGGTGRVLSLIELNSYFLRLPTEPYFGSFGGDDPQSDFVFVPK